MGMTEPRTEAGRALLYDWQIDELDLVSLVLQMKDRILAVEEEAYDRGRRDGHAEYEPSAAELASARGPWQPTTGQCRLCEEHGLPALTTPTGRRLDEQFPEEAFHREFARIEAEAAAEARRESEAAVAKLPRVQWSYKRMVPFEKGGIGGYVRVADVLHALAAPEPCFSGCGCDDFTACECGDECAVSPPGPAARGSALRSALEADRHAHEMGGVVEQDARELLPWGRDELPWDKWRELERRVEALEDLHGTESPHYARDER